MNIQMNKIKKRIVFFHFMVMVCLLCGCHAEPDDPGLEGTETEETEIEERNPYAYEVHYLVPDGLNSSGSGDNYEIYFNEDMTETYTAWVWTCYEDMEQYMLSRYAECRTTFPEDSDISSVPGEEIIGNDTVRYITVSYTKKYEDEKHTFHRIYAGVYLPEGILFEVEAEVMDYDGDFGFEKVRPFFEELSIQRQSET